MAAHWRNVGRYRGCVERTIAELGLAGLCDARFQDDVLGRGAPVPSHPAP